MKSLINGKNSLTAQTWSRLRFASLFLPLLLLLLSALCSLLSFAFFLAVCGSLELKRSFMFPSPCLSAVAYYIQRGWLHFILVGIRIAAPCCLLYPEAFFYYYWRERRRTSDLYLIQSRCQISNRFCPFLLLHQYRYS